MPVKKYIPKGYPMEAVQWTGFNYDEVKAFVTEGFIGGAPNSPFKIIQIEDADGSRHRCGLDEYIALINGKFSVYPRRLFEIKFEEVTE